MQFDFSYEEAAAVADGLNGLLSLSPRPGAATARELLRENLTAGLRKTPIRAAVLSKINEFTEQQARTCFDRVNLFWEGVSGNPEVSGDFSSVRSGLITAGLFSEQDIIDDENDDNLVGEFDERDLRPQGVSLRRSS